LGMDKPARRSKRWLVISSRSRYSRFSWDPISDRPEPKPLELDGSFTRANRLTLVWALHKGKKIVQVAQHLKYCASFLTQFFALSSPPFHISFFGTLPSSE
jgi:hypothetical protein